MNRPLCAGKDPDWWTPEHDMARLALMICNQCTGCPDNDPRPHGVLRSGIPHDDRGNALPLCACGYPADDRRASETALCHRCAPPPVDRWRNDIVRWRQRGDTYTAMGRRIGADRTTIRDALARWARTDRKPAPAGAPIERKTV